MKIFENIVGQSEVVSILERAIQESRKSEVENQEMTHSWLFTGPSGSGKSTTANAFAAALVCPNNGCANCVDCETAINGSHLDIEILKTEGLSIKIDEVRDLLSRSATSPSVSNWRIILIHDIQRLTESAANALLKAIEEPSERTIWILTATSSMEVLPTIRSRCRNIQLKILTKESIVKLLNEKHQVKFEIAEYSARVSLGDLSRAISISQNPEAIVRRNQIIDLIFSIKDSATAFKVASRINELVDEEVQLVTQSLDHKELSQLKSSFQGSGRSLITGKTKEIKVLEKNQKFRLTRLKHELLDRLLLDIFSLFRDIMIIQIGYQNNLVNIEKLQLLMDFAKFNSYIEINEFIEQITNARVSLKESSSFLLILENLMNEIIKLVPKQ